MNFKEMLLQAKSGEPQSTAVILNLYKPLLVKESIIDGVYDEDLYQELCMTLLHCIRVFKV